METFFLVAIVILGVLAVLDLTVGVSNDAVNFLNSAIGSKVAPIKVILCVAAVGIVIGAASSSGMMEIARKGIFHPNMFTYYEIMMLFLAVMFGDIILLDLFNTFGMPTSTTVSLIFGLLGSAVAVGSYKIWSGDAVGSISQFINSSQAMGIILGILMSVVIAFTCGAIVMYISRIIFTFNYKNKFRKFGSIWCGVVFTTISYFAIVKGLKGTVYEPKEFVAFVNANFGLAVLIAVCGWSLIMFIIQRATKINILKIAILAGTFALALAFAGNDLVNFIGVFMAGLSSFNIGAGDAGHVMVELLDPIAPAHFWYLLLAGAIMIFALFTSKKIGSVSKTEVNLARQDEGQERFGSSLVSRSIVRSAVAFNNNINKILPARVQKFMEKRFEPSTEVDAEGVSFDQIRATVNLTTAAILICIATSFKLPLSTTYVTFMVAMGSSLADRAWGRESAVYRITGVLTVISGWFFTAFMAFTLEFLIGLLLMSLGFYGLAIMVFAVGFVIIKSSMIHKKRKAKEDNESVEADCDIATTSEGVMKECATKTCGIISRVVNTYCQSMEAMYAEDRRALKNANIEAYEIYEKSRSRKYTVYKTLSKLEDSYITTGHYYVQVVDYTNEVSKALMHITKPTLSHVENNHSGFSEEQIEDLKVVQTKVCNLYVMIEDILTTNNFDKMDVAIAHKEELFDELAEIVKRQLRRIKNKETSTRSSMLYLDILNETKSMILQAMNLLKSQNYFVNSEN